MLIEFDELIQLPPEQICPCFRSPEDWAEVVSPLLRFSEPGAGIQRDF